MYVRIVNLRSIVLTKEIKVIPKLQAQDMRAI